MKVVLQLLGSTALDPIVMPGYLYTVNHEGIDEKPKGGGAIPSISVFDRVNSSSKSELTTAGYGLEAVVEKAKDAEEGEYNPFEHRKVERPNSDLGGLAHLLKSSLGTGILAMPNAFRNGGLVLGTIATLFVGYICTHCVYILVDSSHTLCRRLKVPSLTYAETAEAAIKTGPILLRPYATVVRRIVDVSLALTYYSAACVYVVFMATSTKQVADLYVGADIDVRLYVLMFLLPLLVLGSIRDLKFLVPFSAVANICIVISFALTLYYVFREIPTLEDRSLAGTPAQLPLFFATAIFAMEGIGVVMPVENSMKHPQHFLSCPGVLCVAMTIVVSLYTVIGFFGYIKYGDLTQGSITLNLPTQEPLAQAVKVLIAVSIVFTYGLQFYVPTEITWRMAKDHFSEKRQLVVEYIMRWIIVVITVIIAAIVPHLGPIISLVGALFFSTLGLIIPAAVDAITSCHVDTSSASTPSPPFRFTFRVAKDAFIILFALVGLLSGTYASVLEIIEANRGSGE
ncbi:hypothetical protein J437_LFUL010801 [Ladona fulva]|uniref:Amino acid transporter transmembrane domain-containing protein n=1 Tax=Ladona fulva TaxID=123851 RepID=A0A8K0KYU7_LADFU|nr:hypothetical protein J437_LFUL010801 [Ladona fulva]